MKERKNKLRKEERKCKNGIWKKRKEKQIKRQKKELI